MAEANQRQIHPHDLNAKWDACIDLAVHRLVSTSLAGAFTGLLLFRSPTTRWALVAFGAGIGLGSAYIESSYIFSGPPNSPHSDISLVTTTHI